MMVHLAVTGGLFDYLFRAGEANINLESADSAYPPEWGKIMHQANCLQSFYYSNSKNWLPNHLDAINHFLLDSGIFSLVYGAAKGRISDQQIIDYTDRYADYVQQFHIKHYFEMDLDAIIGEKQVRILRDRLESKVGWQCIPVWHINRGKNGYLADIKDHPYIAIAGLANYRGKGRKILEPLFPWLIDQAHEHHSWIHALGYTNMSKLQSGKYRFDSVDSTAWVFGNMSGTIFTFNGQTIIKHKAPKGKKLKTRKAAAQNFAAWVKYASMLDSAYPNYFPCDNPQGWN